MVIQCPDCQTRFKLADEKIKPEGIKVRCSRCRHIFSVLPPAEAPEPAPEVPADEPAPREEEVDFGAFNMESVPAAGDSSPAATDDNSETAAAVAFPDFSSQEETESAGNFSFPEPTPDAAREVSSELPDSTTRSIPFGEGETETEEETIAPSAFAFEETEYSPPEDAGTEDEFAFGELPAGEEEADAFSFQASGPDDFTVDEEATSGTTDEFSLGGDDFAFEESESAWSAPAPGDGPADDFDFTPAEPTDDSEEFDFSNISFGEDTPESLPPAEVSFADPEIRPPEAAPAVPAREERRGSEPLVEPLPMPARRRRKSPISGVFVFVVLLLLALSAAAAYFFWQGGIPDLTSLVARITGDAPPPAAAGEIRLSDLNGSFVTNDETGQLFVIQGRATNAFPEARSAIAVKGVLYNKSGKALLQQTVFSGNPLNEDALHSLPFAKIEERMNNQFGDSLSNLNVGPGKAIPFTIVFKNLPSDLAEFTVEVTDSKPGAG